jgi:DNA primase
MTSKEKADIIKATVSMGQILTAYGFDEHTRHHRMECPLHSGDNKQSFSFTDFGFQCFSCGAHGGQVSFVEQLTGMSFDEALEDINQKFNLWPDADSAPLSFRDSRRLKNRVRSIKEKKDRLKHDLDRYEAARLRVTDADSAMLRYAPNNPDDPIDERYAAACQDIQTAIYRFETMQNPRIRGET